MSVEMLNPVEISNPVEIPNSVEILNSVELENNLVSTENAEALKNCYLVKMVIWDKNEVLTIVNKLFNSQITSLNLLEIYSGSDIGYYEGKQYALLVFKQSAYPFNGGKEVSIIYLILTNKNTLSKEKNNPIFKPIVNTYII